MRRADGQAVERPPGEGLAGRGKPGGPVCVACGGEKQVHLNIILGYDIFPRKIT